MFPIRDNVPVKTIPFVNFGLIAANVWVFFQELALKPRQLDRFIFHFGLVPARYAQAGLLAKVGLKAYLAPFFTSMFLHGGWMHILSNMWVLFIFGDNIEDRLGHVRYLFFYLLAGLAAAGTQVWFSWGSAVPTVGASGAIAGVMGAFFVLYPFARVATLIPIFFFYFRVIDIPAVIFLGVWLWIQISSGLGGAAGGIAWWAHVGGFLSGIALLLVMGGRRR